MLINTPIWFIVGASSGLCRPIASEALKRGHKVIACARSTESIKELRELGAYVLSLDVTADDEVIAGKVEEASAAVGGITHLINGAGYFLGGMVEEISTKEVFDVFNANLFGTLRVIRAALPHIRRTETSFPKVIANFGSSGSWTGWVTSGGYCGTKWAVSGMTESLAGELAPLGIKAVVIEPGAFKTEILNTAFHGRRVDASRSLNLYKDMREAINTGMAAYSEPGDPAKAGPAIVDVLTSSGSANGREVPLRLILGSDAVHDIRKKCTDTLKLIDEWLDVANSTDFPKE